MKQFLKSLWQDESGATAIEYSLIAGIMAAVIVTGLTAFSEKLSDLFTALADKLESVTTKLGETE
ncbi:MAG: Flp family type IVb pilin [Desulfobacula sp.]|uniref:Flp family type IVb pilin n=1 Tax=Desulfobacula sp. TaxID=2593537 RepID=UPI0025B7D2CD|nr:Flp family type IVb pilin [Desulfobacula sp.]MCD4719815.1 Flp family type IVb pilin [Desulfobacula sp.]